MFWCVFTGSLLIVDPAISYISVTLNSFVRLIVLKVKSAPFKELCIKKYNN